MKATKATIVKAAAVKAAFSALCATGEAGYAAIATAAYDAANAVYRAEYSTKVTDYAAANIAAWDAIDMLRI